MRDHARNAAGPGLYAVLAAMLFIHSVAGYLIHH